MGGSIKYDEPSQAVIDAVNAKLNLAGAQQPFGGFGGFGGGFGGFGGGFNYFGGAAQSFYTL